MTVTVVGYGGGGGGVGRRRRLFARALNPAAAAARHRHSHVPHAVRSSSRATGPAFDSTGKRRRDHFVFASLFVVGSIADVCAITVITVTISTRVVVQFRKQIDLHVHGASGRRVGRGLGGGCGGGDDPRPRWTEEVPWKCLKSEWVWPSTMTILLCSSRRPLRWPKRRCSRWPNSARLTTAGTGLVATAVEVAVAAARWCCCRPAWSAPLHGVDTLGYAGKRTPHTHNPPFRLTLPTGKLLAFVNNWHIVARSVPRRFP